MKKNILGIGLLLNAFLLSAAFSNDDVVNNVGGIFLEGYLSPTTEEPSKDRISISCDLNTSEEFENFHTSSVQVIVNEKGEKIKSSLYLIDKELKVKIKDQFITIGSIIERRAALFPEIPVEGRIEGDSYVLNIYISKLTTK